MKAKKYAVLIMLGVTALLTPASAATTDSISFTDDWQDSVQGGVVVSQDTGTFTAVLTVPGLSGTSQDDLLSTTASITFGDISFSEDFDDANSISTSSAKFLDTEADNNGNTVTVGSLTFSYSGDVVKISGQVKNPLTAPANPIIADQYLGTVGPIQDQEPLEISFSGPTINFDLQKTVYITGTGSVTNVQGNTLNTVKVSGAVNFTPPALSFLSPAAKVRLTNSAVTVEVSARDTGVVTNVELSLNDGSFISATQGLSNVWSTVLDLSPGTNVIQAYAVDADGYVSTTDSLTVQYIVVSVATVDIDGQGTVSPDYNGESLQVGGNYSMTAKAAKGFGFVNWTDGNSNVLTSDATLKFEMTSNAVFVANFADITRPTLTITSPKNGGKSSNDLFTVTGTAQDNVAVASVWLSVNAGAWTQISLLTGGTWNTQVTLNPGTNTIAAFAVDTSGNDSPTNTVKLDYILSAPLTVQITGSGTLSPDYNNDLLAIGSRYTMKATAGKGFAFYFWNVGGTMSSNPDLSFTMASNLVITANFKDVTKPTLSITYPVNNLRVSNTVVTVSGKAADNVGVAGVGVRINDGDWVAADLADGGSNWTAANLPVNIGTNVVQAYAMDAAGNLSLTNEVKFIGVFPPDWAPGALTGSTILVTPAGGNPISASFDATTFSQTDPSTNGDSGVGTYEYTKDTTNLADLFLTFQAPPSVTNDLPSDIQLTFTNLNAGVYTNLASLDTGLFAVVATTNLLPTAWSGHILTATDVGDGGTTTATFKSSSEISILRSNSTTISANYVVASFSPVGVLVTITYKEGTADFGEVTYLQLTFTSKTQGKFEVTSFDSSGTLLDDDFGTFTWK